MPDTITIPFALFRRMACIIDSTVNAEDCLCDELSSGNCLYCQASEVQDEITKAVAHA